MKTIQDFYFRDIDKNNLPTTIHFEEGNLFIENYQSGYGSGKKTVIDGFFTYNDGKRIEIDKMDILSFRNRVDRCLNKTQNRSQSVSHNKQFDLESALNPKFLRILNEDEKNKINEVINNVNIRVQEDNQIKEKIKQINLSELSKEQLNEILKIISNQ